MMYAQFYPAAIEACYDMLTDEKGAQEDQGRIQQRQIAHRRGTLRSPKSTRLYYSPSLQLKAICIEHLQKYVGTFQERRSKVSDAVVDEFMSVRPLEWKGNPRVPRADLVVPVTKTDGATPTGDAAGTGELSKNAMKKLLKEQQIAAKKAQKAKEKEAAAEGGSEA